MTFIAPSSSLPNLALEDSQLLNAAMPPGRALTPDGTLVYLDRLAVQIVHVSKNGEVRLQPSAGRAGGGAAQGFWSPTAFAVDNDAKFVATLWMLTPLLPFALSVRDAEVAWMPYAAALLIVLLGVSVSRLRARRKREGSWGYSDAAAYIAVPLLLFAVFSGVVWTSI